MGKRQGMIRKVLLCSGQPPRRMSSPKSQLSRAWETALMSRSYHRDQSRCSGKDFIHSNNNTTMIYYFTVVRISQHKWNSPWWIIKQMLRTNDCQWKKFSLKSVNLELWWEAALITSLKCWIQAWVTEIPLLSPPQTLWITLQFLAWDHVGGWWMSSEVRSTGLDLSLLGRASRV